MGTAMIDFNRLRCLHAVATHGSVTKAAAALHLTASAVSQQLSKLEQELGHRLLEPKGRGIRLTEPALVLASHATAVLAQLERARADLEATQTAVTGAVRFGIFPTAARGIAPAALARLQKTHARLEVGMQELEPPDSIPLLLRGDLDVAVAQDWFNAPLVLPRDLERRDLLDDQADLLVPANHRLAKRGSVELAELVAQKEKWISWQKGSICYDWLVLTLRMSGIEPEIVHTAAEHPTQLALVAAGLGMAVIPRLGRGELPKGVRLVQVRPALSRRVYALWRANDSRRPTVKALLDSLEAAAREVSPARAPGRSSKARS
ncbi:MAG TPA: LysR family transcriptional regulator [Myxococcales bacterium]|nr:LysR family transcriptional regulator [Myxococcales bacterium]